VLVARQGAHMSRPILPEERIHPAIREKIASHHRDLLDEVEEAIRTNDVVVLGMAQNPFPRKARKLLDAKSIAYRYLEYGSYVSLWRRRNALKMWSGWPTFPMVFHKGVLVGGFTELQALVEAGEIA
jgi:glutaredoxin-related protein